VIAGNQHKPLYCTTRFANLDSSTLYQNNYWELNELGQLVAQHPLWRGD